jgi:myosin heavy subunit
MNRHPPESLSGKSSKDPLTRSSSYAEMDNAASMDEVLEEPALKPSPVVSSLSSNPDHALITEDLLHERDKLQKELKRMKMCIKEMDDTLDFRQEELQRQERKAKEAGQELQLCKNELKGHKEQITRLQKEKKQAQEQLDDARNHIFQLQPRRIDITETEARELFDSLYNGVQRWVSNRLDKILDMLEEGQLQTCRLDANTATSLLALASAQAMQNIDCDQSDEYVITAIIMQFLHQSFFERRFYCPLVVDGQEQDAIAIIDTVENLMRTIPRGMMATLIVVWLLTSR